MDPNLIQRFSRREFVQRFGTAMAGVSLSGIFQGDKVFAAPASALADYTNPLTPRKAHFPTKAKACIYLYMYGGPSQMDLFDYKPELVKNHGKTIDIEMRRRAIRKEKILGPVREFKRRGQSGLWCSDAFPHLSQHMDKMAVIKSLYMDSFAHGSANIQMNSGRVLQGHPALGAWIAHGLGSANKNLPSFVVMLDPRGGPISGAKNWSCGYMPANYQATVMRAEGTPIFNLKRPPGMTEGTQRQLLNTLREYNELHEATRTSNSELAARIANYELAYKMQSTAPEATDLEDETEATLEMYGINRPESRPFGKQCLLARRLVERGVRFIQLYSGGAHNDDNWDAHGDLELNHNRHALETDKPIAGLLADLKARGLLEETLVVWGGEFGRQPTAEYQKGSGRDHNAYGFTMWMAGGGIKGGVTVGKTDELGSAAIEDRFHVKHLHATILTLLGMDPERLTYFFGGLDQKLIGVEGAEPMRKILA